MDKNPESFRLSQNPDKDHPKQVILLAIGALLLLYIGGYMGYNWAINNQSLTSMLVLQAETPFSSGISSKAKIDTSTWKTFTYSGGIFSMQYPSDWHASQGSSNGGGSGAFIQSPDAKVDISITENAVFGSCTKPNYFLHIVKETLSGCYDLNQNGSGYWNGYVKAISPSKKFGIAAVVASRAQSQAIALQILSTISFK